MFSTALASDANPPFTVITTEDGLTGEVSINRQGMFNNFFLSKYGPDGELSTTASSGANDASAVRDNFLGSLHTVPSQLTRMQTIRLAW